MSLAKFTRHRTLEEVQALAETRNLVVDTVSHDKGGDRVYVYGLPWTEWSVAYNVTNGRFWGYDGEGDHFAESTKLDHLPWYCYLLYFFLVPQVTDWFPMSVEPDKAGVYEVEVDGNLYYAKWGGLQWFKARMHPSQAEEAGFPSDVLNDPTQKASWRGLAVQP